MPMGDAYLYFKDIFAHWWPLVSAGSLLGIEEFSERYWPWASKWLKKIPDRTRSRSKAGALVVAALYSGYLAWNDEHQALLKATAPAAIPSKEAFDTLSGDLIEARAKINAQEKLIASQQQELAQQSEEIAALQPKPARVLTDEQKQKLKANFAPLKSIFKTLQISAPMDDGEAQAYARQFADFFNGIGIIVPRVGNLIPTSAPDNGPKLAVLVKNTHQVPENANILAKAFLDSGFKISGGTLDTLAPQDFVFLVIGQR